MIIKVCGMRETENIREVAELGVDMMGFIFWPESPRFVKMISAQAGIIPDYSEERLRKARGNSQQTTGHALTIATSGSGTAVVRSSGQTIASGALLEEDAECELSVTPAAGMTPNATLDGSEIELTEDNGVWTGNFAMPDAAAVLVVNTGTASGGDDDGDDGLDKD